MLSQYNSRETERDEYKSIINISEKLLSLNPNINVQNNRGETPLHIAILSGNYKIIDMLVSRPDININLQNNNENTALELCLLNKIDLWKLPLKLIELGANVNPIKASTQDDLMQVLAKKSLEDSAIFLADYADLSHVNAEGFTVLHIAAQMNLSNLAEKLLQVGAGSNAQFHKSQMRTPIHIAVEANAIDVLKKIVNQKSCASGEPPNFDCKDENGNTPLSLSIELGLSHLVSILIEGGANVNARNDKNMTLLHQSILNKDADTAILLLQNGADANFLTGITIIL